MKRLEVKLTKGQHGALETLSAQTGMSKSEHVRLAIAQECENHGIDWPSDMPQWGGARKTSFTLREYLSQLSSGDSSWLLYAESIAGDAACATIQKSMVGNISDRAEITPDWICLGDLDSLTREIHKAAGFIDRGMPPDGEDGDLEYQSGTQEAIDFLLVEWGREN